MKINGRRTLSERVEVNVDPIAVLCELNLLIRNHIGIEEGWYLATDDENTGRYVIKEDDHPTRTVDYNPSEDKLQFLMVQKKYYQYLQNAVYNLDRKIT